jgi:hypothetical protein
MAGTDGQHVDGFELLSLPGPALDAVARAVKSKGSLLRTSTVCRDAVLATCKFASLKVPRSCRSHRELLQISRRTSLSSEG